MEYTIDEPTLNYITPFSSYSDILEGDHDIAIVPWGSIEPHGPHLPYLTDGILASSVAVRGVMKTGIENRFMVLNCVNMGSQNTGQTNKKMCIHFNGSTQYAVLDDIVSSLESQGIRKLVIVNGHNGNSFKMHARDTENSHRGFKVYVCNYLDIVEYGKSYVLRSIPFPEQDDHAGFTETSLMLHYFPEAVKKQKMKDYRKQETEERNKAIWTPRDWDKVSSNTGIGDPSTASAEYGKEIAEYVESEIASALSDICGES